MAKEVGSVDLDELMKAREELDASRGVETDPNMYANYNPNRSKEEQSSASQEKSEEDVVSLESEANFDDEKNSETQENSEIKTAHQVTSNQEKDFSVYENFAEFDIIGDSPVYTHEGDYSEIPPEQKEPEKKKEETVSDLLSEYELQDNPQSSTDVSSPNEEKEKPIIPGEPDDLVGSVEDEIKALLGIVDEDEDDEEKVVNSAEESETSAGENSANVSSAENVEVETQSKTAGEGEELYEGMNEDIEKILSMSDENSIGLVEEKQDDEIIAEETKNSETQSEEVYDDTFVESVGNTLPNEIKEKSVQNENSEETQTQEKDEIQEKQNEIVNSSLAENLAKSEEDSEQKIKNVLSKLNKSKTSAESYYRIQDVDFVDVAGSSEFEQISKYGYVLGRNEETNIEFTTIKDMYNVAVFSKNDASLFKFFGSMMLSLMLKGTPDDAQFAVVDSKSNGLYSDFSKSSYVYDKVSENIEDAISLLNKVVAEIDERYETIAKSGTKNIDDYNKAMEEVRFVGLPYIVLVVPNLQELYELDQTSGISQPLTYILKYGRLVGVYAYIGSSSAISSENINFNLSTRIAFKAGSEEESSSWIGESKAESISDEDEFIMKTISSEQSKRYRVPELNKRIAELLIENIDQ